MGKVNTLEMYPMTFEEFLWARGFKQRIDLLQHGMWDVVKSLRTIYIQHLREYYLVGGMPEAVNKYIETNDANAVREVQEEIIRAYEKDISKHAPKEQVVRINQVWNSIPSQLAKENKKFIYGVVKQGARAKDYELAIQWLIDAGLVYKISRVKTLGLTRQSPWQGLTKHQRYPIEKERNVPYPTQLASKSLQLGIERFCRCVGSA